MSFDNLGLAPVLLQAIKKAGFNQPTQVQQHAIPMALEGHDLIVTAQTGSGKTAAFMLPSLQRLLTKVQDTVPSIPEKTEGKRSRKHKAPTKENFVQILVLTPTRELALQVAEAVKMYSAGIKELRVATVVGGMPYGAQIKALARHVDILVATPGRLIDHLQAKRINLSQIQTLVLDEADRMLDMGFIDDIEHIVAQTSATRQTLMFSATFEGSVAKLAEDMLTDPQRISIADQKNKHDNIKQCLLYADDFGHKFRLLDYLLRDASLEQAIVFTATKRGADDLAERLKDQGFAVAALHGDMNQRQRTRTLNLLQKGRIQILVATDVAARGIDVQGITHSINYDLPMQPEDYVHRIGRTGRAGRNGLAFTLATHSERFKVRRIEQFIHQTIETSVIPGLEPTSKPTKKKESRTKKEGNSTKRTTKRTSREASISTKKSTKTRKDLWTKDVPTFDVDTVPQQGHRSDKRLDLTDQLKNDAIYVRQPRKTLTKEEQPRFADFERGARSNKAKYNRAKKQKAEEPILLKKRKATTAQKDDISPKKSRTTKASKSQTVRSTNTQIGKTTSKASQRKVATHKKSAKRQWA